MDVNNVASTWISIADIDGNKKIDKKELFDFFILIEGIKTSEDLINHIFEKLDKENLGLLGIDQFAEAIQYVLYNDYENESQEEIESDSSDEKFKVNYDFTNALDNSQ